MINTTKEGRTFTKDDRLHDESLRESCQQSYKSNSHTEKICLEIANNFESHFAIEHPHLSKSLYIVANNEFGIPKCVCTTLKPELLGHSSLYDVEGCSHFLSQYMEYEPLKDPRLPPKTLPSPSQVLSWGVGDCFDLSILLVSFLLGAGYDAYVVFGVAPKWICARDRSNFSAPQHEACQFSLSRQLDDVQEVTNHLISLCKKGDGDDIKDSYDQQAKYDVPCEDSEVIDPLQGNRIHCWVAIKSNLRCDPSSTDFFIEPSTGERYVLDKEYPYLQLYAVWNTKNYWINKNLDYLPIQIDLDAMDTWEKVFLNTSLATIAPTSQEGKRKPFDPPYSWVKSFTIPQDLFVLRYPPHGQRVALNKKAKLEYFGEGIHKQGLVKRITSFHDKNMLEAHCQEEYFGVNRIDHLLRRIRLPNSQSFHEDYSEKQLHSISCWMEICGRRRTIIFREQGRGDNLIIHDECFGKTFKHTYKDRRDRLIERISYLEWLDGSNDKRKRPLLISTTDGTQNVAVTNIVEKFRQPSRETNEKHIAKRTLCLKDKKVVTEYFRPNGGIDKEVVTFASMRSQDSNLPSTLQNETMDAEKSTSVALRSTILDIIDIVRMRKREEDVLRVDLTKKEDQRISTTEPGNSGEAQESQEANNQFPTRLSYLLPFLLDKKDIKSLSKEEATQIKDDCFTSYKNRFLQRADIMQNRLNREKEKLSKMKVVGKQTESNNESKHAMNKINFSIEVLEKRLREHEELSLQKCKALESKIMEDLNLTTTAS